MTTDEKTEIEKKRNYIVAKSNIIVQRSRYELSVTEQRTIAYICSMINPIGSKEDKDHFVLDYEFNIRDYAKTCGLECDNGRIYEETKTLLKGLVAKVMWLTLEDGTETTVNWVQKVWTNKRSGKAKIRLDEDMTPYLFDLKQNFLSYGLINILAMKSQFSIRLYELLKSYAFQKSKNFDLEELKRMLLVDNIKSYGRFPDFRRKVLEKAIEEINNLTDIKVKYEPITKGKKVVKLKFNIYKKTPIEYWQSGMKVNEILEY